MKIKYLLYVTVVFFIIGCTTDEIDTFDHNNYLSFQKSELSYTFAFLSDDVTSSDYEIPVAFEGRYLDRDAKFRIVPVIEKSTALEGVDFQMLDDSKQVISAGSNTGNGKVRLIRSAKLKDEPAILTLAIERNDWFLPGVNDTLTITVSDRIVKPDWWNFNYNGWLGNYSKTKLLLWLEFMGVNDGSNPLETEEYSYYVSGSAIIRYYNGKVSSKVLEFQRWLLNTKNNPMDPDLGRPVAQTLGSSL